MSLNQEPYWTLRRRHSCLIILHFEVLANPGFRRTSNPTRRASVARGWIALAGERVGGHERNCRAAPKSYWSGLQRAIGVGSKELLEWASKELLDWATGVLELETFGLELGTFGWSWRRLAREKVRTTAVFSAGATQSGAEAGLQRQLRRGVERSGTERRRWRCNPAEAERSVTPALKTAVRSTGAAGQTSEAPSQTSPAPRQTSEAPNGARQYRPALGRRSFFAGAAWWSRRTDTVNIRVEFYSAC